MRRSRLLLLMLLPAYGLFSSFLSIVNFPGMDLAGVYALLLSNPMIFVILISVPLLRADEDTAYMILIVSNLAFWLPVAHLTDVLLEKVRRRRARRRG